MTAVAEQTKAGTFPLLAGATCLPWVLIVALHDLPITAGLVALVVAAFGVAHVPTTAAFYFDPELRPYLLGHTGRFVVAPLAVIPAAGAFAWLAPVGMLQVALAGFIGWQIHHFTRQNLGMLAFLFCSRQMPGLTVDERRFLWATEAVGLLGMVPMLPLYSSVPFTHGRPFWLVGAVVLVASAGWLVTHRPADPVRARALTMAWAFYLPLYLFPGDVVPAVISFGAAHGLQYLVMMGHLSVGRAPRQWWRWLAGIATLAIVGRWVLEWAGDQRGTDLRWLYGMGVGVTMVHFIVDAGVWKLRDPAQRAYMRRRFAFL